MKLCGKYLVVMIRFDRFTLKAQEAVQESQNITERHEHQAIDASGSVQKLLI